VKGSDRSRWFEGEKTNPLSTLLRLQEVKKMTDIQQRRYDGIADMLLVALIRSRSTVKEAVYVFGMLEHDYFYNPFDKRLVETVVGKKRKK